MIGKKRDIDGVNTGKETLKTVNIEALTDDEKRELYTTVSETSQLPVFSANNARGHVPQKARQSLAGVGLQGDAKGRSGH